jgi:hypothetical protein
MKLEVIKKSVAHLPHVKTVWVKDNNIFIQEVAGAEKVELGETAQPNKPIEPVAEPASQPNEPIAKADTTSTNKKK